MRLDPLDVAYYYWREGNDETPGIIFTRGRYKVSHMTETEALALANKIVDLIEHERGQRAGQ